MEPSAKAYAGAMLMAEAMICGMAYIGALGAADKGAPQSIYEKYEAHKQKVGKD